MIKSKMNRSAYGFSLAATCSAVLLLPVSDVKAQDEVIETTLTVLATEIYQPAPRLFMEYVEEKSDGRIVFNEFVMDSLGSDTDLMEMVYHGSIDITTGQIDAGVSTYIPSAVALSHPFAYDVDTFIENVFPGTPIFEKFQELVRKESNGNLHALNVAYASARNVYAVPGPIRVPQDLADNNVRIRVPESPLHLGLWQALGATPVGVPGEQRYEALMTGMVNALEGGMGSAVDMGLIDYTKYTIMTNHIVTPHFFMVNADWYDSLPADLKEIVDEGAKLAAEHQNELVPRKDMEAAEIMVEAGVEIIELTPEERAIWANIATEFAGEIMSELDVDAEFLQMVLDAGKQ